MNNDEVGPIVIASDRGAATENALRATALLARRLGATVRVVAVVEPLPVMVPNPSTLLQPLVASPELMDQVRTEALEQVKAATSDGPHWRVTVEYGRSATEVCRVADEVGAQLIVIGHTQHGMLDRILDGDTALAIVRHANSPVLLAAADFVELPQRAVFAVDFSPQSMNAARAGIRLLAESARVHLVHVKPRANVFEGFGLVEEEYQSSVDSELASFAASLGGSGQTFEKVVLEGSPARALLEFAESSGAQLIVAATRGAGLIERILVGSVATRLMRHSRTSVLIVPDADQTAIG